MTKRYQVFISSTYSDLKDERKYVMQTLLEMDCIPAGMELFPATDEEQWEFIKKIIDDCDYYLLIVGGRYGSLSNEGISYTEKEFDYAKEKGLEIISLMHSKPDEIPLKKSEQDTVLAEKLNSFREKVKQGRIVKFWERAEDLSGLIATSLNRAIKMKPAIGWVRANLLPTESASGEILRLQSKIVDLEAVLEFSQNNAPIGTENLSQGDDLFTMNFTFNSKLPTGAFSIDFLNDTTNHKSVIEISWNMIFASVAPLMINETDEKEFIEKINELIRHSAFDILTKEKGLKEKNLLDFEINTDDFHRIKIQLRALGLITESKRNRSIKDTDTYWTLTPYGDRVMTRLLAIKK
jgi:hypothetical protein